MVRDHFIVLIVIKYGFLFYHWSVYQLFSPRRVNVTPTRSLVCKHVSWQECVWTYLNQQLLFLFTNRLEKYKHEVAVHITFSNKKCVLSVWLINMFSVISRKSQNFGIAVCGVLFSTKQINNCPLLGIHWHCSVPVNMHSSLRQNIFKTI